jgi:hypothetical protein
MRRYHIPRLVLVLALGIVLGRWALAGAQGGTPALPQGAVGVTAQVLGAIEPASSPGYELQLFRSEWEPGSSISSHTHPGALVSCVESGTLTFEIQDGAATVIRAHDAGTPAPTETILVGTPITYGPGDCVAFDQDATATSHTAWNDGSETVVLWEAHLYKVGEPASTFTEEAGTPAA